MNGINLPEFPFVKTINPSTQNHPFPRRIPGNANRLGCLPTTFQALCLNRDRLLLHRRHGHKRCIRIFCSLTLFLLYKSKLLCSHYKASQRFIAIDSFSRRRSLAKMPQPIHICASYPPGSGYPVPRMASCVPPCSWIPAIPAEMTTTRM